MLDLPLSLARDISPPPPLKRRKIWRIPTLNTVSDPKSRILPNAISTHAVHGSSDIGPTLAAVEAGKAKINDHLAYFQARLAKASRHTGPELPRLPIENLASLYRSNQQAHGHHFVIHQHNHPRAGVHYDLRLQFSETSSMSFAVSKGLPGNPNSRSIGRMAIETRVHNFWNHLIESASSKTGSLLIWDTGTYSSLPRINNGKNGMSSPQTTDDESDEEEVVEGVRVGVGERPGNEKLISAFQTRYIRLRLHGTRLPKDYTIILRLPSNEISKRSTVRRRISRKTYSAQAVNQDSDVEAEAEETLFQAEETERNLDTDIDEDAQTRATNAYPGSVNSIESIYQRHWFLQLDRQNSGFMLDKCGNDKGQWTGGFDSFLVRGRDYERSVVTGRLSQEVESDEGVEGSVGRGGWTGIEN